MTTNIPKEKILYAVMPFFYPHIGGMEIVALNTYKDMAKLGWKIHVVTQRANPLLPEEEIIEGVLVHRLSPGQFGYMPWKLGLPFFKDGLIILHDFRVNPSLLICGMTLILKALGRKQYKLLFFSHGGLSMQKESSPKTLKFKVLRFLEQKVGPVLLKKTVDTTQAVSETEKTTLQKLGFNGHIEVTKNGLEREAFDSKIFDKASQKIKNDLQKIGPYILQVSRVVPVKNIETVILTLPEIPPEVSFVIAGDTSVEPEYFVTLQKLVKKLGLQNRVYFLGNIFGYDKYLLMKQAKLFVLMSHSEGFPNALLEAMSQGCACIVSSGTGMTELVEDGINGFCLPAIDYQALAKKINFLTNPDNSDTLKKQQEASRDKTKDKTWSSVAVKMENFYLKTLTQ